MDDVGGRPDRSRTPAEPAAPGPPARLGLDETTFRRPQRFATGLVDLDSGRLWDLVEGSSRKVVTDRLAALGVDVASIEDVVIERTGVSDAAAAASHSPARSAP